MPDVKAFVNYCQQKFSPLNQKIILIQFKKIFNY